MYNSALSFTFMNATLDQSAANNQNGAYAFRIHCSVYHLMSSALMAANDTRPKFAQIYIFDGENELQNRLNVAGNPNVERTTMRLLQNMMHEDNPFVDLFKTMEELSVEQSGGIQNIRMIFRSEDSPDPRRYNRPRVPEIGVLLFDGDDESSNEQPKNRDIVLRLKGSGDNLTRINETNQFFDPLQYVLMFPFGDLGWHIKVKSFDPSETEIDIASDSNNDDEDKTITIMQYYSSGLMVRQGQ